MRSLDYVPDDVGEELFELVGRIKAFAAYVNSTKYSIERELCAAMLGFELEDEEEKKSAKDDCPVSNIELD